MLREIDGVAAFLSYRGDTEVAGEDETFMADDLMDYFARWNDQLQRALSDVQLVAGSGAAVGS